MDIGGITNVAMMNSIGMSTGVAMPLAPALAPAAMDRMDLLVQLIRDYTSAEILMALLLSQGTIHDQNRVELSGSTALAAFGLAESAQIPAAGYMALPAIASAPMGFQISVQA